MSAAALTYLRLELADALRSRWLGFTAAVYAALFLGFVGVGLRESAVLGFTGLSRVVLDLANAVVVVLPLVVLVATCQSVVRARASGLLELVLAQPARRGDWLAGLVASRVIVLVGPLLLVLVGAAAASLGLEDERSTSLIALRSAVIAGSLVWAFLGMGLLVSTVARTAERAIVAALVLWATASALHDFALIGLLLRLRVAPHVVFALGAANPVEAARVALLAGVDPDLTVLGPVGFWLANSLGPRLAFAIGAGWPLVLGTLSVALAARKLNRADLIG
jgi:ABC-2 type transport system permease protein